jgi:hypothetical protein
MVRGANTGQEFTALWIAARPLLWLLTNVLRHPLIAQ